VPRLPAAATLLAASLVLSCRGREAPQAPAAAPRTPRDVVLVTIDTLRYDAVGFDGNPRGTTPNLDRFASEGRVFTFTHAHNVVTLPSHTNILTGLYPYQHGVRENAGFRLRPDVETLATLLRAKGYATGAFVGAFVLDARYGLSRGFDVYEEVFRHRDEPKTFDIQEASGEEVVGAGLRWFREQAGKPRFLWVHLYDPHAPYKPPKDFGDKFPDDPYLGEVAYADAALSPLLEAVRGTPTAPFLMVTGDHGEARGDHGELTHGLFTYESTLHVPLFLWCPGLVPPGRDDVPARHVDLLPTVLDAIGSTAPAGAAGRTLLDPRRVEATEGSYFEALSATFNRGWAPLRGVLAARQKYIELPIPELYDLRSDPAETKNLVGERSDALRRLRKQVLELPATPNARGSIGTEEAAKLRSLGYLAGSEETKTSYGPADDPKSLVGVDQALHRTVELFEQNRLAEAAVVARQVVAETPNMRLGYLQLATVLEQSGDLPGAIRILQEATKKGAGGESLDRREALLLCSASRPKEAVALLEPYRPGEDVETLNALGIALADAGQPAKALEIFSHVRELDPTDVEALQNAGITWLKIDRPDEARKSLEAAVALGSRRVRAWNALGVAWMQLQNPARAIEAWERCVALNPEQYDALYNLGRAAGSVGDWPRARRALEQFVRTAPASQYGRDIAQVKAALADMDRAAGKSKEKR